MEFIVFDKFDESNTFAKMKVERLDDLNFGAVQVDAAGRVLSYNRMEAEITGKQAKDVLGKNFFTDIAPCTQEAGFHGRFTAGVAAGNLDVVFEWHLQGAPRMPTVQVHLKQGRSPGTYWIFTKRL
jgi:photoactive yellow protein